MFNRTTNNPQDPASSRRKDAAGAPAEGAVKRLAPKAPSIVAADLIFEGNITGDGEIMIDGVVKGQITAGRVVVGQNAEVIGSICAGAVEIRGCVRGDIEAKAVRLLETAKVEGDITHEQLSIDLGAVFEGRCKQALCATPSTAQTADIIELDTAAQR